VFHVKCATAEIDVLGDPYNVYKHCWR